MSKNKFNHKRRKKMRRKIKRKDPNWEQVFIDLTNYEISIYRKEKENVVQTNN